MRNLWFGEYVALETLIGYLKLVFEPAIPSFRLRDNSICMSALPFG